ncbi:sperm-associated antigen 1 [Anopheles bellator]|uniref:sperm-associated antigen 1 n=1 Tax=Anopheles bellator TaxID=139047 RepID=UPI002649BCC3|nr:sperm-associated antigen 1 [Anopheles bellator]
MANKPRTRLLEKYDILLDHLDFEYIRRCECGRKLENIVRVLRSGEEGYFPQLTTFAEERLRAVLPGSRVLRKEQPLATRHTLAEEEWDAISAQLNQWQDEMKSLAGAIQTGGPGEKPDLPPVRQVLTGPHAEQSAAGRCENGKKDAEGRIGSCDYGRWDQYDPEAEMLKMDLDEERHREFVRMQNQKNLAKPKIEELPAKVELSEAERGAVANRMREKGNDYFRAKEYREAVEEYGKSLSVSPTAVCFNNRAMAYIKLHRYKEAIADCDQCLSREPQNLKALLRKAQALVSNDNRREAYRVYGEVLRLEPANKVALSSASQLRAQLPDLPPPNAVRMAIEEVGSSTEQQDSTDDIDFRALVKPKKIIKDRLPEALKQLKADTASALRKSVATAREGPEIRLRPGTAGTRRTPLIEEL